MIPCTPEGGVVMGADDRPHPRSPAGAPSLMDHGLLRSKECSPPERAQAVLALASWGSADAENMHLMSEILGLTRDDWSSARKFLGSSRQRLM